MIMTVCAFTCSLAIGGDTSSSILKDGQRLRDELKYLDSSVQTFEGEESKGREVREAREGSEVNAIKKMRRRAVVSEDNEWKPAKDISDQETLSSTSDKSITVPENTLWTFAKRNSGSIRNNSNNEQDLDKVELHAAGIKKDKAERVDNESVEQRDEIADQNLESIDLNKWEKMYKRKKNYLRKRD